MDYFNPETQISPRVLATDLDGTLIPLPNEENNKRDLDKIKSALCKSNAEIIFATGRHYESVVEAIEMYDLPTPDWIVCDVGSAIYRRKGKLHEPYKAYEMHLCETVGSVNRKMIEELLAPIEGLEMQPIDHQQTFKISYQSESDAVEALVSTVNQSLKTAEVPYACMGSVDPFMNCGLLDVMPRGVSKASALIWLSTHADFTPDEVIYAGDSGNDYAALVCGFRAIVVKNHSKDLDVNVGRVHESRGLVNRLYLSNGLATSGVLEGLQHFGLV